MGDGELTTVVAYGTLQDAEMARFALEAEGINAIVLGANTMSMLSYMLPAVAPQGVRVAVLPQDADRARQLLEEWESQAPADQHTPDSAENGQPATPDPPAVAAAERAKRLAILSVPIPPLVIAAIPALLYALLQPSPPEGRDRMKYRRNLISAAVLCAAAGLMVLVLWVPIAAGLG